MANTKPLSLWPLTFDEALRMLLGQGSPPAEELARRESEGWPSLDEELAMRPEPAPPVKRVFIERRHCWHATAASLWRAASCCRPSCKASAPVVASKRGVLTVSGPTGQRERVT